MMGRSRVLSTEEYGQKYSALERELSRYPGRVHVAFDKEKGMPVITAMEPAHLPESSGVFGSAVRMLIHSADLIHATTIQGTLRTMEQEYPRQHAQYMEDERWRFVADMPQTD